MAAVMFFPASLSSTQAIYVNSNTGEHHSANPPYTPNDPTGVLGWNSWDSPGTGWNTITLSTLPEGACAMSVGGILVITHGYQSENADLRFGFRKVGDTVNRPYIGQCNCVDATQGVRIPFHAVVPLVSKQFMFKWACIDSASANPRLIPYKAWPNRSSYAINLTVQAVWMTAGLA